MLKTSGEENVFSRRLNRIANGPDAIGKFRFHVEVTPRR
jgi:hypothetical protein